MNHLPSSERPTFVGRLIQKIYDRRERVRLRREFDDLEACGVLDEVLAEAGLSRSDLPTVLRGHPRSGRRHAAMKRWIGVDSKPSTSRSELRDAELSCIRCGRWRECEHWFALPADERPVPTFCPNISAFRRIRAWQASQPT